jgi:PAS domain S-box-containing protein
MDQRFNAVAADVFLADAGISAGKIISLLPLAACICDHDGKIKYYNEGAAGLWGRRPVLGEYLPAHETVLAALEANSGLNTQCQMIVERPDLSRVVVKGNIATLNAAEGTMSALLCLMQDVTGAVPDGSGGGGYVPVARDLSEELKQSEERYHKMIEEVEDYAILLMDKSGVIQNWNKGAEKIKGYHESEIIGRHFSVFYLPEDRKRRLPETLIAEATRTGKALQEGWRMRKNGTRFWGSIVITALHNAKQEVIGFSKVTRDLTEKKMAEDRIRQYASELEFQNKELEQFAYAAAHDMKEPLRKIQFYNNHIFDNVGNTLPEKARDYLTRSISAANRMQGLIDDLLAYSKASSFTQEMDNIDLNTVVNDVLLLHHETIERNKAIMDISLLPVVKGVAVQITQLFDNLIGNALKYRHPDRAPHISITVSQAELSPDGRSEAPGLSCFYKISVADNGIGFNPDYAEKIFDMFQRLHTQAGIGGSGIGLAICKKIVLNHHGFIRAHAIPGEGARFDVFIPCE